jgi:ppGpp synthetase/RelA/SpoT-type nucleotidyltranferase
MARQPDIDRYSKNDVLRAGKLIAVNNLPYTKERAEEIERAFLIANRWRNSHSPAMKSIRLSVGAFMRNNDIAGLTAARLKQMPSIRRKLARPNFSLGLNQIQDIGGCRAILHDIESVHRMVGLLRRRLPSEIYAEDNYIESPKDDGYRSHHLMFKFRRKKPTPHDGKRIELQVRTLLQHSWATAMEAVGLFRGEDLKYNQGNKDWLRLFLLMSAEFAEAERCFLPLGTPEQANIRREEIKHLASSLDAVPFLEKLRHAVHGTEIKLDPDFTPKVYLIRFVQAEQTVYVEPHRDSRSAMESAGHAEATLRGHINKDEVVVVEVDKVKNLKAAYPNYFGDVEIFSRQLKEITIGKGAVEYKPPPKALPPKRKMEIMVDPKWLYGSFRKPKLSFSKDKKKP